MTSQLKPGAAYVYERDGSRVYAREVGSTVRQLIGEDYSDDFRRRSSDIADEWIPIVLAAEQNSALQDALDRAKIIYELTKQDDDPIQHHPV